MKTIHFVVFILLLIGVFWMDKAEADCPPGWNEAEIIQPYVGDCRIRIVYCYKCGVTGAEPANIKITFYGWANPQSPDCTGEIPFYVIWEAVRQSFYNNCLIPPCSTGTLRIIVEYPMCKKTINEAWQDEQGNWHNYYWEIPCSVDFYYCQFVMEVCYMGNGQYQSNCLGAQTYGFPESCLALKPPLPPSGLTWFQNWESECYVQIFANVLKVNYWGQIVPSNKFCFC